MMALNSWLGENPTELAAAMMSFGPLLAFVAIGAGSAIEVGLIGRYDEEDMREWRASLGAYLLIIGTLWALFSALSVYGPLLIWEVGTIAASAAGATWVVTSISGAWRAERSDRWHQDQPEPTRIRRGLVTAVFIIGLVVSVAMLATLLQGVVIPGYPHDSSSYAAGRDFLRDLAHAAPRTWAVLLVSGWITTIACVYININLFGLNPFSPTGWCGAILVPRDRGGTCGRTPNFALTNSPVPVAGPTRSPGSTPPTTSRCATWPSSPNGVTTTWWSITAGPTTWSTRR